MLHKKDFIFVHKSQRHFIIAEEAQLFFNYKHKTKKKKTKTEEPTCPMVTYSFYQCFTLPITVPTVPPTGDQVFKYLKLSGHFYFKVSQLLTVYHHVLASARWG